MHGALSKCKKDGCSKQKAKGKSYCSRSCAPQGHLADSNDMPVDTTAKYSGVISGEVLGVSKGVDSGRSKTREQDATVETKKERILITPITNLGAPLTESEPKQVTAVIDSETPYEISRKAISTSINLIDESTTQLRQLMREVTKDDVVPITVKSAVDCASQIHNLIRLKLDIVKESRSKKSYE